MELDQLRYFLQVAKRGNFTRAAEDLIISQPALSRSIQKLEEELGQPVFESFSRATAPIQSPRSFYGREIKTRQKKPTPGPEHSAVVPEPVLSPRNLLADFPLPQIPRPVLCVDPQRRGRIR